jgi:hypothetical protein
MLTNLGPAADSFVLAGAQALKFLLGKARATRDFDFVLDVVLSRDYHQMEEMFPTKPLTFDKILARLEALQERINALATK